MVVLQGSELDSGKRGRDRVRSVYGTGRGYVRGESAQKRGMVARLRGCARLPGCPRREKCRGGGCWGRIQCWKQH